MLSDFGLVKLRDLSALTILLAQSKSLSPSLLRHPVRPNPRLSYLDHSHSRHQRLPPRLREQEKHFSSVDLHQLMPVKIAADVHQIQVWKEM